MVGKRKNICSEFVCFSKLKFTALSFSCQEGTFLQSVSVNSARERAKNVVGKNPLTKQARSFF